MDGVIVRDVSGNDKEIFYVIFKNKRKIYKVKKGAELDLVKVLNVSWRWYDDSELNRYLKQGFVLVNDLKDLK
jgi:hypothetical protein